MIVYPARGAFRLWQERHAAEDAVRMLLGHGRAVLLRELAVPTTTSELARRLGVTPGAVSQQVSDLRRIGVVTDQRSGRLVHHALSARGEALLSLLED
ncbi:ArsR/SmtB family transcription factor [Deinococcus apachensis]|uniref:ArsR/SmtB family transcription factor n=1 Tax=Deinococcus apachensis TaxID=309886 RepID=UPI00036D2000|nr:winged helix-turn-helix domain-containing protein [Deinococcus apachensis]